MPTAYTAGVAEGKIVDLQTFAMQCARNFGALIMMRDEPFSAPIPETFAPSTHYADRLAEEENRLSELEAMTAEQVSEAYLEFILAERKRQAEEDAKEADISNRYNAMLAQVSAWVPPTEDHVGLKEFMMSQIEESIRFDCGYRRDSTFPTEAEWRHSKIADAFRSIAYYRKERDAEIARVRGRNDWLSALRKSLPAP